MKKSKKKTAYLVYELVVSYWGALLIISIGSRIILRGDGDR